MSDLDPASRPTPVDNSRSADARRLALIALAYAFSLQLALFFPSVQGIMVVVWPPGGVALAALLLSPRRQRLAILATIFAAGNAVNLLMGRPGLASIGFMVANVLETWACAWLFARWCRDRVTFERLDEIQALAICALVVNSVTASVGAAAALLATNAPFHDFYVSWWISDGLGILFVTPLVVVCAQPWRRIVARRWWRRLEATSLAVVWCACIWVGFVGADTGLTVVPRAGWICLPLVWAALRFGTRITTILLMQLAVIVLSLTAASGGAFTLGGDDPVTRLQRAQLFLGVVALGSLLLTAAVNERRQAEDALEEHRARLALAMDQAHVAYWEMDADSRIFTFNDRFYALYGTTAEREGGYRMSSEEYARKFLPPEEQHVVPDDVGRLLSGEIDEFRREHRIRRRDGELRDIVVRVTVNRDATGRVVGTRGANQDITDLRRMEAEREQFHTLFDIASDVMVIADPEGCFLRVNPATIKLLGYSEAELLGQPFINLVHPDDRQATLDEMARQIRIGTSMDFENRYVCKDGSVRRLSWRANYVKKEHTTYATARDFTEQRVVEDALRASEKEFRSLAESMPQIVWASRPDGAIFYSNPQWVDYTGLSVGQSLGDGWTSALHPDDVPRASDAWQQASRTGEPFSLECRLRRADSVYRWFLVRSVPVRNTSGEIIKWFGTSTDIEDIRQTAAALRESDERFRNFFELSADLVCIADISGRFRVVNSAFSSVLGYSEEELVSRPYLDFVHPDDRERTMQVIADRLTHGETVMQVENRYVCKNGEIVWLEWTAQPSVEEGVTFAIARDITERKKADEKLLQVMAAVESSSNAIGISDLHSRHFYQNRAYTQLFGYATAAELQAVGGGAATVCDPAVGKELFDTILAGKAWSGELKLVTKYGRVFDAFELADAIKDKDGNMIGLIGVVTDISDRVSQQRRLRELLAQTEQDARTKGELLREVNHRVTNNLTAVLGLISFELRHTRGDPQSITSALARLNQHIRGLLHVHRVLSQSAWAPVRLNELAGQIIRAALSAAGRRQPAVLTIKAGELRVSPRQAGTLAMVLNELATNTVKHADRGTGAVSVGFESGRDVDGITLCYRDNGPGYPPDVLANERSNVGLKLINEMVTKSLGGTVAISNHDGAVTIMRIRAEEEHRT